MVKASPVFPIYGFLEHEISPGNSLQEKGVLIAVEYSFFCFSAMVYIPFNFFNFRLTFDIFFMNIDKIFESMSLEEEEVPFNLPDLPQFSAVERNKMSITGRTLNPEREKSSDQILDMPRKWQMYDRVKGIALSKTTF